MDRTDIHRPSAIIPENYQFVAFDYTGGSDIGAIMMLKEQREIRQRHMNRTGGSWSRHEHGGSCYVCGAFACYLCTFWNEKTNEYINTGEDCAQKLDMSYGNMNFFRKAIHDAREAQAGKKKAQALLADQNLTRAWELVAALPELRAAEQKAFEDGNCEYRPTPSWYQYEERTIEDIITKVIRFGNLSEKAAAFLHVLLAKIDNRAEIEAKRAAESEAAAPCPSGRVTVVGRVLGMKTQEGAYGTTTKILVQALSGFKVYGSRFANVEKGDLVCFDASVTASTDDKKFGFFKRGKGGRVSEKTGEIVPEYPYNADSKVQAAYIANYGEL